MVTFLVSILALSIVFFGLLYQFALGVGILLGFERKERRRGVLLSTVAPIWRGNETWLSVAGIVLCAAFPVVYPTLLSAFYVPFLLMLAALILRGVATELRHKTERRRWLWNAAISGASLVAAFMQGLMLGTLVEVSSFRAVSTPETSSTGGVCSPSFVVEVVCALAMRFWARPGWRKNMQLTCGLLLIIG
jgi:cytochrome d ubiquinol oxidase subunit II